MTPKVRLQKFLAAAGVASRRKSEDLIRAGRVRVDGVVVTELGTTIDPEQQSVEVNGVPVKPVTQLVYHLLNKPRGYLVTASDGRGRKTIYDLLGHIPGRVVPVGRLDLDSEGLLILTNDGELAHRLMHPSFQVKKQYEVEVEGRVSPVAVRALERGVMIDGKRTAPAAVELVRTDGERTIARITISEGRKRQVRLMFAAVDHPVLQLKRTREGSISLGNLASGKTRPLTMDEISALKSEVGLPG